MLVRLKSSITWEVTTATVCGVSRGVRANLLEVVVAGGV